MLAARVSSRLLPPLLQPPYKPYICTSCLHHLPSLRKTPHRIHRRSLRTTAEPIPHDSTIPFRKRLKDEARAKKKDKLQSSSEGSSKPVSDKWELTVGLEIHAELNTAHKLFSSAATSINAPQNTHVALFDAAFPGVQPHFQPATLIPAIRAALAFHCEVQTKSSWDRKHYFYPDQPNGYQITQYYEPFARGGQVTLTADDGIDAADGGEVTIGLKQIQMEQDTGKTLLQPPSDHLLDFNRVSHPLIEIITLPQIHHPATAAACVRKIQTILRAVDAVTAGMELGGLRADVNVSVKERGAAGEQEYAGVKNLGQRTEIKNLSSFKAVEDAIIAERDRQIAVLEAGGTIEGETRGWTLGAAETTRLRGKEGEVDYRYMPDPDLGPLIIGQDLVSHLSHTRPLLPDEIVQDLMTRYDFNGKDARTLALLDDGDRYEYFEEVMHFMMSSYGSAGLDLFKISKTAKNWVLHEIGGLLTISETRFSTELVPAKQLASLLFSLTERRITGRTAKYLLSVVFAGDGRCVDEIIENEGLLLKPLSDEEYLNLAQLLVDANPKMAGAVRKGQMGKVMWFVGEMMRAEEGRVEAKRAEEVIRRLLIPERQH